MINHDVLRAITTIAFVAAMAGCSPTEPRDFLDARLVLEEPVVRSGAASGGRVEVTNHGSEAVAIIVDSCPPRVLVFDQRGNSLERPIFACPLILTAPVTIEPGATHTYVQGWIARDAAGDPLPSGTYRVQAWVALARDDRRVLTNRATVEVQEEVAPAP